MHDSNLDLLYEEEIYTVRLTLNYIEHIEHFKCGQWMLLWAFPKKYWSLFLAITIFTVKFHRLGLENIKFIVPHRQDPFKTILLDSNQIFHLNIRKNQIMVSNLLVRSILPWSPHFHQYTVYSWLEVGTVCYLRCEW